MLRIFSFYRLLFFHVYQECRLYFSYNGKSSFWGIDRLFKKQYRFFYDYTVARRFYKKQKYENCNQYGPTPIFTIKKIAKAFKLKPGDSLLDLGCGTGRHLHFLEKIFGVKCFGIEMIEDFYRFCKRVTQGCDTQVRCSDLRVANLSGFHWIFFFATSFDDLLIKEMCEKFLLQARNSGIITVSFPLSAYNKNFQIEKEITVSYPWGRTKCYLNRC